MNAEEAARQAVEKLQEKGSALTFCVFGAGHGGLAMAGHLGIMGYDVRLYNRSDEGLNGVRWHGGIQVDGAVEGFGPVKTATSDIGEAVTGADVVMIVVPSTAHRSVAERMADILADGQIVILNPGRTGGTLEFHEALRRGGCQVSPLLGETSTFIYASRAVTRWEARIFRVKNSVRFSMLPSYRTPEVLRVLNQAFPQFIPGDNVLATGMENIGAVFHPALTLINAGWIEKTGGDFDYYIDGITPSVARLLEKIDAERVAVAASLGIHSVSAREWLYLTYDSPGKDLHEAIQNTAAYRGIRAPQGIDHRYVTEDVPMSLVPLASIGRMRQVPTPMIDMVIDLANAMNGTDYRRDGRTAETMGIAGLSLKDIRRILVGVAHETSGGG